MPSPLASKGIDSAETTAHGKQKTAEFSTSYVVRMDGIGILWLYISHFTVKQKAECFTNDSSLQEHNSMFTGTE